MAKEDKKVNETIDSDNGEKIIKVVFDLCAQKNGEKFRKLFYDGDTQGYKNKENADIAICEMISFRAKGDISVIDGVYRMSKLYDDKWEKESYRRRIIETALNYSNAHNQDRPEFIVVNNNGEESISKPLLIKYIREKLPYKIVRNDESESGCIYYYINGVYKKYSTEMFSGEILKMISNYNQLLIPTSSFINDVQKVLVMNTEYVRLDALNRDEEIINFKNGIFNITNEKLLPHSTEYLSTVQINCEWHDEKKETPVFDKYLSTLSGGDKEVEEFLLQYMGVCISNVFGKRLKKALFIFGDGNTGKSQYKLLIEALLGDENCQSIDLNQLEARFGTGTILGKRLIGSADMSYASVNEMKNFKQLTGGDRIFAEKKGQQAFQFEYRGMMLFIANKMPLFGGDNGRWVYERIIPLKCENIIANKDRDPEILEKMIAEKDGIIQKIIPALRKVISNGYKFNEPQKVIKERELYEARNNSVIKFIRDKMVLASSSRLTISVIYSYYQKWCDDNSFYVKDSNQFKESISEYLSKPESETFVHKNDGLHIIGLDLI